jgi:hypothetical protein
MVAIYGIVGAEQHGLTSSRTLGIIGAGFALFAAFLAWEGRVANPILPGHVLRLRSLMVACGVRALTVAGLWTTFFLGALYFERVRGFTPTEAGAAFLPQTLVVAALSLGPAAWLADRYGTRRVLLTGLVLLAAALGLLGASATAGMPYLPTQAIAFTLAGLGGGMSFMSLMTLALADVPAEDAGVASGIVNVSVQIAAAFGLAVFGTVAASRSQALTDGGAAAADALASGYRVAFLLAAASVATALLVAYRWLGPAPAEEEAVAAAPVAPPRLPGPVLQPARIEAAGGRLVVRPAASAPGEDGLLEVVHAFARPAQQPDLAQLEEDRRGRRVDQVVAER